MPGSTFTEYTALHGSCAVCEWCGSTFEPRIRAGPNRDRFCQASHKDRWWNRRRRENPPAVAADTAGHTEGEGHHPTIAQGESKLDRVLAALASGRSLTRLEAERELGDHVLPSTISAIEHRVGVHVSRHLENRLARYWLEPGERKKAALIILNTREACPDASSPCGYTIEAERW